MDTELDQPTVVVGIDGSAGSRNALAAAVRSASWRGARVRAVTVFEPFEVWSPWPHYVPAAGIGLPDPARIEGEDTEAVHGLVSEVLASMRPEFGDVPEVDVEVLPGRAANILPARARDADELVVGHRGRGAVAGALLGSVGWACVLHAPCPVTIVTATPDRARPPTVVVGIDGSDHASAALRYATQQAAWRGARLRVVMAYEPPGGWVSGYGVPTLPGGREIPGLVRGVANRIVEAVRALLPDDLRAVPYEVDAVIGTPSMVLVDESWNADLLVVGHRGRGSVRSVLVGSTGLGCVLHARCPVTVVPGPAGVHGAPVRLDEAVADLAAAEDREVRTLADDTAGPRPIAVGVDGSRGGGRALAWALDRARRTATDVRVVRAYDQPERWPASLPQGVSVNDAWVQRMIRRSVQGEVERVLADQAGHEGAEPRVEIDVVAGHPLEVLLSASRRAGMLVVGHRELGAVRATVLGSTALNLLVLARCPVTVVPRSDHTSPVAASRTDEPTVVVGVDRSEGSRRAMRHALEEAATRGARVLAVSAFLPALTGPGLTIAAAPTVEDVRHAVQAQIRPFVEDIVAGFSAGHGGVCPPVRVQVQAMSPVWALVDAAREAGAELIVIGHRGRGALATRLLGSVGHGVLLQASCPVTMVPEPDDVAPEQELAAPAPADTQESPRPVGPIA